MHSLLQIIVPWSYYLERKLENCLLHFYYLRRIWRLVIIPLLIPMGSRQKWQQSKDTGNWSFVTCRGLKKSIWIFFPSVLRKALLCLKENDLPLQEDTSGNVLNHSLTEWLRKQIPMFCDLLQECSPAFKGCFLSLSYFWGVAMQAIVRNTNALHWRPLAPDINTLHQNRAEAR